MSAIGLPCNYSLTMLSIHQETTFLPLPTLQFRPLQSVYRENDAEPVVEGFDPGGERVAGVTGGFSVMTCEP